MVQAGQSRGSLSSPVYSVRLMGFLSAFGEKLWSGKSIPSLVSSIVMHDVANTAWQRISYRTGVFLHSLYWKDFRMGNGFSVLSRLRNPYRLISSQYLKQTAILERIWEHSRWKYHLIHLPTPSQALLHHWKKKSKTILIMSDAPDCEQPPEEIADKTETIPIVELEPKSDLPLPPPPEDEWIPIPNTTNVNASFSRCLHATTPVILGVLSLLLLGLCGFFGYQCKSDQLSKNKA
nr:uncharacterized protein LOC103349038 [Oryctolagus cuniculus]